jgi:hypothetical protein
VATGGTGAALFVGANIVSGTPGASRIPIAQSTGKLLSSWLDLASVFRFDGGILSTASSTFNATTTIVADSVTNRALVLNGLAYQFPTTPAATSGLALTSATSGILSWNPPLASAVASHSTSSTGFSSSYVGSTTIRHNLGVKPRTIRIKTIGWSANSYAAQSLSEAIISRTNTGTSTIVGNYLCTSPVLSSVTNTAMTGGLLTGNYIGFVFSSGNNSTVCDDGVIYAIRPRAIDETTMTIAEDVTAGTGSVVSNASTIFEFIP